MSDHDALRDAAGPWVLGALDEDEAWTFAAHLEVCAVCRDEVERLRVAADALPLAAPPVAPPPELKTRLMAIVEAEAAGHEPAPAPARDRAPWWRGLPARPAFAAAAAALLLVVGGVAGFAARGGGHAGEATARVIPMTVSGARARGARADIVQNGQGYVVRVSGMPAPPPGRVYQVWLQRDGAAPSPDAVFTVDRAGRGAVGVLGKVSGRRTVLVTDEPLGGSTVPSRQPVLRGSLA
jgi:anti-sigma-K factor RskA